MIYNNFNDKITRIKVCTPLKWLRYNYMSTQDVRERNIIPIIGEAIKRDSI